MKEKGFPNLVNQRCPVNEDRAPGEECFDIMVEMLKKEPASTPCIFSDQMGRGRTTLGMIIACLIKEIQITTELRWASIMLTMLQNILCTGRWKRLSLSQRKLWTTSSSKRCPFRPTVC